MSLAVPIVLPMVLYTFVIVEGLVFRTQEASPVVGLATTLIYSLAIGGVPYVVFALGTLWWSKGKPSAAILGFGLVAPLVYTGVFAVLWFMTFAIVGIADGGLTATVFQGPVVAAPYYLLWCLGIGYSYVFLVGASYSLLRRIGVVHHEPSSAPG